MRCFIRHNVIARDLWILISAQQLTQKKVGEYLMFFQNNTRSKFTTASSKSPVTQRVAIAVSKRSALHSRLRVLDFYLSKIPPFQNNILKDYFFTALVDSGEPCTTCTLRATSIHCFCFIYEGKIYVCTHIKVTRKWKSTLISIY